MALIIRSGRSPVGTVFTWDIAGPSVQIGDVHALQRVHDETGHLQIEIPDTGLVSGNPTLFIVGALGEQIDSQFLILSRALISSPSSEIILNVRFYPYVIAFILAGGSLLTPVKISIQE